jgi:hypothetical protein
MDHSNTLLTINTLMIEYEAGAASSAWAPKFALVFGGVRVAHLFNFLCFCFVCLRSVSCVPSVAGFSGLYIIDCPFDFLYRL